jgi:hypothetical protein
MTAPEIGDAVRRDEVYGPLPFDEKSGKSLQARQCFT